MTQPTALYLADVLANDPRSKAHHDAAAAELRRLHAENFTLAAGQCVHATADEGGTPMCAEVERLQAARTRDNVSFKQLLAQRDELLEALERSRAQWIHSVNADRCLAAIAKAQQ